MDNYYNKNFSLDEGKKCISACIKELTTRFVIALENFTVRVIDQNGITDISADYIKAK